MGGYERHPAPWSLDGVPADFNGKLLAPDWPRFAEIMAGAVRRVPAIADAGITRMINGPEGVHARQRVHPRRERRPRLLRRRRVLRPRHRRRRRDRPPGGELDRRRRAGARPVEDGHPAVRAGSTGGPRLHARPDDRGLRDLLRHPLPERGAPGRPAAAASSPTYERLAGLGAVFGEKSGWERPNWFEPNARRAATGERSGRAAGPGSTGARRSPPRRSRRGAPPACSTRRASRRSRSSGPAPSAFLERLCANEVDVPVGRIVYTSMLNRRGGIECDLTVTRRRARIASSSSPAPPSASTTSAGSGGTCPPTAASLLNDITSGRVCFGLWGPRARDILAPLTTRRPLERGLPVPDRAADHGRPRAGARAAGHVRRRARLGAVRPHGVRAARSGTRCGRRAGAHGLVAGGYRAIDALRLEKGYRVWSSDITPDETPFEAGLGFAVALDKGAEFIGRDALVAAKAAGPRKRLRCLVLDDPRSVCLGNEPVRVDGEIVGRVTSGGYGLRRRALDRLRLPAARRRRSGRAARSTSSASGSASRSSASRSGTRQGARIRSMTATDDRDFGTGVVAHRSRRGDRRRSSRLARPRPWPPATRPTPSPEPTSGATSRSRRSPTGRFVTQADTAIERLIRDRIMAAFPDHGLVGEEYGTEAGDALGPLVHRPDRRHPQLHPRRPAVRDAARGRARRRAPGGGHLGARAPRALVGPAGRRRVGPRASVDGARGAITVSRRRRLDDCPGPVRLGPGHRRVGPGARLPRPARATSGASAASATSGATRCSPRARPRR